MNFEFATANRIIFGPGSLGKIGALAAEMGSHAMVVTGLRLEKAHPLFELLRTSGIEISTFQVDGEPTIALIDEGVHFARQSGCDLVIGCGGGSALDAGKAIAALCSNPGEILDYLEVVGKGRAITSVPLPYIAIPTTSGTGTEVTRNAVLGSPEHKMKVSLRSPLLLPRIAMIDPELTYNLPPDVTARTGLDALTQLIEPFVSNAANPMTDAVCRAGLPLVARSLRRAYLNGEDREAREEMSLASLFGGMALANAKLGAVHGFAASLGGMFPAPHGAVCARLLPFVMGENLRALRLRQPDHPSLGRYVEIAAILTGDPGASAEDGVSWAMEICKFLKIPPLSAFGVAPADFPELVENASKASSMQGNPIRLTPEELESILTKAL
jgi:alcohol dehydrogenase class IV